ncbi:MAG: sodium:proton antiporter, partial [Candidatus Eremiobacteraeota bacterium]|nr:sodium:proton antiporter [Candidatus Eremiobacteraeota bacterium]
FKSLGVPKRLALLVEGESLLNDGTAIVLFTLVLTFVGGGAISPAGLALDFVTTVGAGVLIGSAVGLVASQAIRQIDDAMLEITITTIAAYGSFILAEQFHFSGVIATVVAGLFCGNYAANTGMAPTTRIAVELFWEYVAFALNSIVFLLIGFEVRLSALLASWQAILVAYIAVIAARALVVSAAGGALRRTRERIPPHWNLVLTWGGLRGGVSMVLALGLPRAFPHREFIVTMTFGVVLVSIVLQGLTMAPLLRRLGIVRAHDVRVAYERARSELQVVDAALSALDTMARARLTSPTVASEIRRAYEARAQGAQAAIDTLHLRHDDLRAEETDRTMRHLLAVEKEHLIEGRRLGVIDEDAYETLLADADARLIRLNTAGVSLPVEPSAGRAVAPEMTELAAIASPDGEPPRQR